MRTPRKGAASVVHFYTGDTKFYELCQNLGVKLNSLVQGYEKSIVLKSSTRLAGLDLSSAALNHAWKVKKPTAENFIDSLVELTERDHFIDVFVIGHGSFRRSTGNPTMSVSEGLEGGDRLATKQLKKALAERGHETLPIRLVGQWICYGSAWNETWKSLGAKCVFGARGIQWYPNKVSKFGSSWRKGKSVSESLADSDTASARTLAQAYIATVHAPSVRSEFGGCPPGKTILGKHACSKKYFKKHWNVGTSHLKPWPPGNKSGKQYMNWASVMLREGPCKKTTMKSKPKWSHV